MRATQKIINGHFLELQILGTLFLPTESVFWGLGPRMCVFTRPPEEPSTPWSWRNTALGGMRVECPQWLPWHPAAGNPGMWSLWGSFLPRCCIFLPVSRLPLPQCHLPAAAWELFPSSQHGTDLLGHTAASPATAGDHSSPGACRHAQQHAWGHCRLCRPGRLHQPQHQSGSDAAPDQPDGRPQLWAPALVQAAERRQRGGPQVRLPGVSWPALRGTQMGGSSLGGGEEDRRALTGLCLFQPD